MKLLIKNMFDHRRGGWLQQKQKNEEGPMKVEQLRQLQLDKLRKEEELRQQDDGYPDDRNNYRDRDRGGDKGYGGRGGRGGRDRD